jgi:hypothetical protein
MAIFDGNYPYMNLKVDPRHPFQATVYSSDGKVLLANSVPQDGCGRALKQLLEELKSLHPKWRKFMHFTRR